MPVVRPASRRWAGAALLVAVVLSLAAAACTDDGRRIATAEPDAVPGTDTSTPPPTIGDAEVRRAGLRRATVVTGSTCGDAGGASGSGVIVARNRILTAAHVIAGVTDVTVSARTDHPQRSVEDPAVGLGARSVDNAIVTAPAVVIAFDPLRDLALLEADLSIWSAPTTVPDFAVLGNDDRGVIVGGLTSGDVDFVVTKKTIIEADEVRGNRRSRRSGYLLAAETTAGDSGAGLYDGRGRFVGLLFAVSTDDGNRSWATAADEIEQFLADDAVAGAFECNPDRSMVERRP